MQSLASSRRRPISPLDSPTSPFDDGSSARDRRHPMFSMPPACSMAARWSWERSALAAVRASSGCRTAVCSQTRARLHASAISSVAPSRGRQGSSPFVTGKLDQSRIGRDGHGGRRCYSVAADQHVADFAFAFDIDGVLLHSSTPLPGASESLAFLQKHRVPFILLTNGGGKHETERVAELSTKLGVPLSIDNFIQSHTPFQQLVDGTPGSAPLRDKCVLVTGGVGDKCREVAERYGFQNVVTPGDIFTAYPEIWPFSEVFNAYHHPHARPLPRPIAPSTPASSLKIDAIFVFNDPRDWALDVQLVVDLLVSKDGVLGTYSKLNGDPSLPNHGWQQDGQPRLYCSNPDLLWATGYHLPRLGQGGFQAALRGVWDAMTGGAAPLDTTIIGKPHAGTYAFAEDVLHAHRAALLGRDRDVAAPLRRVFMVGDNPASDIAGANAFASPRGVQWSSILLKTGVYRDGTTPAHTPTVLVPAVMDAVRWALEQQGWSAEDLQMS